MKKTTILIIILFFTTITNCLAENNSVGLATINDWTGLIRIEGKEATVWMGEVTVRDSTFFARNVDTGEKEEHYISYPIFGHNNIIIYFSNELGISSFPESIGHRRYS